MGISYVEEPYTLVNFGVFLCAPSPFHPRKFGPHLCNATLFFFWHSLNTAILDHINSISSV